MYGELQVIVAFTRPHCCAMSECGPSVVLGSDDVDECKERVINVVGMGDIC